MSKLLIGAAIVLSSVIAPAVAQEARSLAEAAGKPMTRADVETRVKQRFAKIDADRNGSVTKAEIDGGRNAKMKERQDRHFTAMDANQDGLISRAEFDAGHAGRKHAEMKHGGSKHQGRRGFGHGKMFDRSDANADGKLTLAETMAKAMARFDAFDANKDGTLTPEERKAAREKMREARRAKRG